jgi:hypothetical protein
VVKFLLADLFAERSLDLAMNDARKLLVRKLPLDHFPASFRQRKPSFVIIDQSDTIFGQTLCICCDKQRITGL